MLPGPQIVESSEEDMRAAKLALARRKLKDHQDKKTVSTPKVETVEKVNSEQSLVHAENNNVIGHEAPENIENIKKRIDPNEFDINLTEILISNKTNLESHVTELESELSLLKSTYNTEIKSHNATKQELNYLQNQLRHLNDNYVSSIENIRQLEKKIEELTLVKTQLFDESNNLTEQLELTKSILTAKETENASMRNHLQQLQNEFDVTKLQLQQLNSGQCMNLSNTTQLSSLMEQNEVLLQKVNNLEQQLKVTQKEKDQINSHYENYVGELNTQLKSVMLKNDELSNKVQNLSIRENSLIEQISEMEIRLQNIQVRDQESTQNQVKIQETLHQNNIINKEKDLQEKLNEIQNELEDVKNKYMELQESHAISERKVIELQEHINANNSHENISISKLSADIASDKVAAQRATEQNKKLKIAMQELEEAFVKMTQDKLELTEKISAEKYLNRELTIKLAEIEEKSHNLHTKLMAKDDEMIRLQVTCRKLEKDLEQLSVMSTKLCEVPTKHCEENSQETNASIELGNENKEEDFDTDTGTQRDNLKTTKEHLIIPQEDAMLKLQERFMKIMGEVADLSDEKHRMEHIILQLQNETDTICEYVALYQQQRSLLKKRDEERSAQIQLFQVECDRLKNQLEELSRILLRFAEDQELASYFLVESRQQDMDKVRSLLLNLKSNTLVDPHHSLELSNVYPCNCCSGNLIDV